MRREEHHDVLFQPIRIGPKTLRNRFFQVPYGTGLSRKPQSWAAHRELRAEGGWAAVCTEAIGVSHDSDASPSHYGELLNEDDLGSLELLTSAVHNHGALAGIELSHAGIHAYGGESRWPIIAPSQLSHSRHIYPQAAKAMESEDIQRIQNDFARAAKQAESSGFDIIYLLSNHLPIQFLSRYYNKRCDAYGGTFENRVRFSIETLSKMREAVGASCAIACRVSVEGFGFGLTIEEASEFMRMADYLVDLWDVNIGSSLEHWRDAPTSRFASEGDHLRWTGQVREATTKPIVGAARFSDPDLMANVIKNGVLDLIGAARPSIADPFLPQKIAEGRYDEISQCIGANVCVLFERRNHIGCVQNATVGEEYRRGWHPEKFGRATNANQDVLVIGAGPAGMECAIVLGKRGMRRVHLVEAEGETGGVLRWIPRLPGLGEWSRLLSARRAQLERLRNVEVITGARLHPEDVYDYGAEIVVVATGACWATDGLNRVTHTGIPGAAADGERVLVPEQVMVEGRRPRGERVVVYDCEGYVTGPGLAEKLAGDGFQVELVTCFEKIAPICDETTEGVPLRRRLHSLGIGLYPDARVLEVREDRIIGEATWDEPFELMADAIVLVTQRISVSDLYLSLRKDVAALNASGIEAVYRVGDCVAPRGIADAIWDGHRLGREIDSANPAVPIGHYRERVVVSRDPGANVTPRIRG